MEAGIAGNIPQQRRPDACTFGVAASSKFMVTWLEVRISFRISSSPIGVSIYSSLWYTAATRRPSASLILLAVSFAPICTLSPFT